MIIRSWSIQSIGSWIFLNMPGGTTAVVPSSSAPFNVASNSLLTPMTNPLLQAWADANPDCYIHDLSTGEIIPPMTIRTDDPGDLLPSELDPWPPSDEEIEEREKQALFDDYMAGIPDPAERNRNLK